MCSLWNKRSHITSTTVTFVLNRTAFGNENRLVSGKEISHGAEVSDPCAHWAITSIHTSTTSIRTSSTSIPGQSTLVPYYQNNQFNWEVFTPSGADRESKSDISNRHRFRFADRYSWCEHSFILIIYVYESPYINLHVSSGFLSGCRSVLT